MVDASDPPPGRRGYPRPMLRREGWTSLDGPWEFALDPEARHQMPARVEFDRVIEVPFAPETVRSGVFEQGFFRACWYRKTFIPPEVAPGEELLLHFGAVDHAATVWVDGFHAGDHEGGYTPFTVPLAGFVRPGRELTVVVRAEDDPKDLAKPRGKQDWQLQPHSIWYPRTTGIWQTVWIERVPPVRISALRWTPNLERWEVGMALYLEGEHRPGLRIDVTLRAGDRLLADDSYSVEHDEVHRRIALSDPGIDDSRNELLWSPTSPVLIDAVVTLRGPDGAVIDRVESYTAIRSLAAQGDRIVLNGRPYTLRMVLDQGYWPDTGATAPDDAALRKDVELARAMGFNGVRKHQKIEDPRYLHWADRLGLLVWEEMPSAYRFTRRSIERLTREWIDVLARDYNHPCIVAWVPFNESWGVPNLPDNAAERHYVKSIYHLTRTLDPTRLVVGNDGWESVATDILGIHDYDDDPREIADRYHANEVRARLFRHERPGGRILVLDGHPHTDHPVVLSEFGGIACSPDADATWGYSRATSPAEFARRYTSLLSVVRSLELLSGFCYTQFTDTWQEANGLLYADRRPKFPLTEIAAATTGVAAHDPWREPEPQRPPTASAPPHAMGTRPGAEPRE